MGDAFDSLLDQHPRGPRRVDSLVVDSLVVNCSGFYDRRMRNSAPGLKTTSLLLLLGTLASACGSSGSDGSSASEGTTGADGSGGEAVGGSDSSTMSWNLGPFGSRIQGELSRLVPVEGGVVVATYPAGYALLAFMVSSDGEVKWAHSYPGADIPIDIMNLGDRVRVLATDGVILDLAVLDGSVERAVQLTPAADYRGTMAQDGDLLLTSSSATARLDSDLAVTWANKLRGGDLIEVGETIYVQHGAGLARLSAEGELDWQQTPIYAGGSESPIGLRELPSGEILVASAVNDLAAPQAGAWAALYDSSGDVKWLRSYMVGVKVDGPAGGTVAPLQYGTGASLAPAGTETWLGYVGTSGGLGSNVIASVSLKLSADGSTALAFLRATAIGSEGNTSWGFSKNTLYKNLDGEGCDDPPIEVKAKEQEFSFPDSASPPAQPVEVDLVVTPLSITSESTDVSAELLCPEAQGG